MSDYDPPVTFSFAVGFAGSTAEPAAFQEVSGLQSRHETVQLKEGGENRIPHRLPGRVKPPNLVLKPWNWRIRALKGRCKAMGEWRGRRTGM